MSAGERRRNSLSVRMFRTIAVSCIALGLVLQIIGTVLYGIVLSRQYFDLASNIASQAVSSVTHGADAVTLAEEVMKRYYALSDEEKADCRTDSYRSVFADLEQTHDYDMLIHILGNYMEHSDVYDVYIGMYDSERDVLVYVVDPDTENRLYPGQWEKVIHREVEKFIRWDGEGQRYDVSRTDGYGWLCTAGAPIKDKSGDICAFILVDVTIGSIIKSMTSYVLQIAVVILVLTAVITMILTRRMRKSVIEPVNAIADAAKEYVNDKRGGITDKDHFQTLNIRTGDEIENLSLVMADMERDLSDIEPDLTEATAKNERISTELSLATKLQAAFIPHDFPPFPGRNEFGLYAFMRPAKEVGGDFYDYFLIDDDHLCLVMADVSGKGIPGALFMMVSKIIISSCAMLGRSAGEILTKTNEAICSNNPESMFVTAWLGILEISTGKLTAANAGHEYPVLKSPDGNFELLKDKHGFVVGGMDGMKYTEYEIDLKPGSKLFLYTDGVPEAMDVDGKMFGIERMLDVINRYKDSDPEKILSSVRDAVDEYAGEADQFDDLTMLCFEYFGKAE